MSDAEDAAARALGDLAGKTPQERAEGTHALFSSLAKDERKAVTRTLFLSLPKHDQKTIAREGLGSPSGATRNAIWLIIVISFAIVLLGSAALLGAAVFWETKANATYFAKIETIVTVFTSVLAFLSGLLAPSPIKGGGAGGSG